MNKRWMIGVGFALVGVAVVMFGVMQKEVMADSPPEPCVCSKAIWAKGQHRISGEHSIRYGKQLLNCRCGKTQCVIASGAGDNESLSCIK